MYKLEYHIVISTVKYSNGYQNFVPANAARICGPTLLSESMTDAVLLLWCLSSVATEARFMDP